MAVSAPPAPASVTAPEENAPRRRRLTATPAAWLVWGLVGFFFLNLAGVILSVVFSSFSTTWFGDWLPRGWTSHWYGDSWHEFSLSQVMVTTLEVAIFVVVISLL